MSAIRFFVILNLLMLSGCQTTGPKASSMPLMGLPDLTQENTHAIDAALSGKPSVACNHYAHLLQIHPDHPGLIQNYALSLLLNQQPKEAQQWINRLSADHPLQSIKNLV